VFVLFLMEFICWFIMKITNLFIGFPGTRACLDALENVAASSGEQQISSIAMAGGATRSDMWLQMHADVTQTPVVVGECENAPLLGCGVLAAAALKHRAAAAAVVAKNINITSIEGARDGGMELSSCGLLLSTSIDECVHDMVRQSNIIEPNRCLAEEYDVVYKQYVMIAPALSEIYDTMAKK
jgi:sugar (pentulose or hexulose) kinase